MVVNGGQSVMIHGILTTQMLSAGKWASLEQKATKLQPFLDRDSVRYGWIMLIVRAPRNICTVAVTTHGARTTAVILRMLV